MSEAWYSVPGYEGLYSVNKTGQVLSDRKGKTLKPQARDGYLRVTLSKAGQAKVIDIHRLMGFVFLGLKNDFNQTVDHINEKKDDNRLSNLRILTRGDNVRAYVNSREAGCAWFDKQTSKWRAYRLGVHLGRFKTKKEAMVIIDNLNKEEGRCKKFK